MNDIGRALCWRKEIIRQFLIPRVPKEATQEQRRILQLRWSERRPVPTITTIADVIVALRRMDKKVTVEHLLELLELDFDHRVIDQWRAECGFPPYERAA